MTKAWVRFRHRVRSDLTRHRTLVLTTVLISFLLGILFTYLYGNLSRYRLNRETDIPTRYRYYQIAYYDPESETQEALPLLSHDGVRRLVDSDETESVIVSVRGSDGIYRKSVLKGRDYLFLNRFSDGAGMTDPARHPQNQGPAVPRLCRFPL